MACFGWNANIHQQPTAVLKSMHDFQRLWNGMYFHMASGASSIHIRAVLSRGIQKARGNKTCFRMVCRGSRTACSKASSKKSLLRPNAASGRPHGPVKREHHLITLFPKACALWKNSKDWSCVQGGPVGREAWEIWERLASLSWVIIGACQCQGSLT